MNAPAKTSAIGDNRPPLITADQLAKDFAHVEKAITKREAEAAKVPPVIEDDEDLELLTATVPKLRGAAKRCNELRDQTKRPHLDAGRVIDTWFKALEKRMTDLQAALEKRGKLYLDKKRAAEAARRRAEEAKQREEAERLQQEAARAAAAGQADQAAIAAAAAAEAESHAERESVPVRAADLARTTTTAGTATLGEVWCFEIADFDKIDLNALRPYLKRDDIEKAIRAFVRAGRRELAGVRIYQDTRAQFR